MPGRLSNNKAIVYVLKSADHASGQAGDSINMGKVNRVTFVLQCGSLTGDAVLTVKSGATAGTETTAETFYTRLADADQASANADVFGDRQAGVTTLTLTEATYDNRTLLIEVDSDTLTADQEWLTLAVSSAASVFDASCLAICDPKTEADDVGTVI